MSELDEYLIAQCEYLGLDCDTTGCENPELALSARITLELEARTHRLRETEARLEAYRESLRELTTLPLGEAVSRIDAMLEKWKDAPALDGWLSPDRAALLRYQYETANRTLQSTLRELSHYRQAFESQFEERKWNDENTDPIEDLRAFTQHIAMDVGIGTILLPPEPNWDKAWECVKQFEEFWKKFACDCQNQQCSGMHPRNNCKLWALGWMYNQLKEVFE
jgi:hypothetical protein